MRDEHERPSKIHLYITLTVRTDKDVNEHERPSNITLIH